MTQSRTDRARVVVGIQLAMLTAFLGFAAAVIGWVVHLVRLSVSLDDVPSASMGISLVAIPVFLTLAGIVTYLILGLALDPEARGRARQGEGQGEGKEERGE